VTRSGTHPPTRSFELAEAALRRVLAERHDRPSLVARIACEIGAEIIEGLRRPGEDLNSVELSRRFETSRTPVREALMLLEKEGLVSVPARRRPRVARLTMAEIREIYRTRATLFEHIAGDIVRHASDDELASLRPLLDDMERGYKSDDLAVYVWANVAFYDRVTEIAKNRTVKRILDSLLIRTLPLRRFSLAQPGRLQRSFDDHRRLVRAYQDRDAGVAAALLRSNNLQALAVLEAHFDAHAEIPDTADRPPVRSAARRRRAE
jgi:DNA-binding GntR family transcriptional regulator